MAQTDLNMQVSWQELSSVKPYGKNAKKHPKEQVEKIANSIKRFGWAQPIVVDKNNDIIIGHGRLQAAKQLGLKTVPVIQMENLTEDEVKALRLADNKLNESEWDMDLVNQELEVLPVDLKTLTGFEDIEILDPQEDDFDTTPPVEPKSTLGEIYKLGDHRLMCGDSTKIEDVEKLMDGEKADMVFTDPPYGVDYSGGIQFTNRGVKKEQRERLENDGNADIYIASVPMMAVFCNGPIYTWFADTKALELYQAIRSIDGQIHAMIIWVKNGGYGALNANYKQKHEPCLYWKPNGATLGFVGETTETTIWEMNKDGKNKEHPTQKPIALAARAIQNHDSKRVLDLFGGSGSTLMACEQTKRKCYMMELDPKYIDVIINRWEKFTGLKAELLTN